MSFLGVLFRRAAMFWLLEWRIDYISKALQSSHVLRPHQLQVGHARKDTHTGDDCGFVLIA